MPKPARDWLKDLPVEDRHSIGKDLMRVQFGWPIGMPLCCSLGQGLWEVRTSLGERIARVIFCFHDGKLIALHGFIKKTKKAPQAEIDLAAKRRKEFDT